MNLLYKVRVGKKTYRLRPSYDRVLAALALYQRHGVVATVAVCRLLVRGRPRNPVQAVEAALRALLPASGKSGERNFDFEQDFHAIYAAFKQAYGIDLLKERGKMHWTIFDALLEYLPEDTRFSQIVGIRAMPLPAPTKYNRDYIESIIRQKNAVRLKLTPQEIERKKQEGLLEMAEAMQRMAEG